MVRFAGERLHPDTTRSNTIQESLANELVTMRFNPLSYLATFPPFLETDITTHRWYMALKACVNCRICTPLTRGRAVLVAGR
jgi:hypothetical protein